MQPEEDLQLLISGSGRLTPNNDLLPRQRDAQQADPPAPGPPPDRRGISKDATRSPCEARHDRLRPILPEAMMSAAALQRPRLLSIDDVQKMLDARILHEDEPVELIHGVLVTRPPQGPLHTTVTGGVAETIRRILPEGWHVREEKPLALDAYTAPEPDIAIVRGGIWDWREHHPGPKDTTLVIEVAWSSQEIDIEKTGIYARAGLPVYWLIDIPARTLTVHTGPDGLGRYAEKRVLGPDDEVEVPMVKARWPVRALLP